MKLIRVICIDIGEKLFQIWSVKPERFFFSFFILFSCSSVNVTIGSATNIQLKQFSVNLNNPKYSKGYTTHIDPHTPPFTQNITIKWKLNRNHFTILQQSLSTVQH